MAFGGGLEEVRAAMAHFTATVSWQRDGAAFLDNRYSRKHEWAFDGGVRVAASASPDVVPPPYAVAEAVDPEEAFVASLSSCHMLWFLSLAAKRGFRVDSYVDAAVGELKPDAAGQPRGDESDAAAEDDVLRRADTDRRGARGGAPRGARVVFHRELGEDAGRVRAVSGRGTE
jgi:organic hydroperoxide reductase OsmC/OhrA